MEEKEFSPTPENLFELCQQFSGKLYQSRRFNYFDREDFAQDLYIVLERALKRYDPKSGVPLRAFLWRRAQGYLLDWLRRIKPEEPIFVEKFIGGEGSDEKTKTEELFGRSYQDHEMFELDDLAKEMEPRRRFIYLCLARGYKPSEIADMLGVKQSRVSVLMKDIGKILQTAN